MSDSRRRRGLEQTDFAKRKAVLLSARSDWLRFQSFLSNPWAAIALLSANTLLMAQSAMLWELLLCANVCYGAWVLIRLKKPPELPRYLPRGSSYREDPKHQRPGEKGLGPPCGDVFLGVDASRGRQVWMRFQDWLRHALVTGTTGSGKTELLISIAYNFLCGGGNGMMFADPKGDLKVAYKLAWIAKRFGREDDLLICHYAPPPESSSSHETGYTTNTCNPASYSTAKELATMLVSLLPKNDGGSNAVFADNAVSLIQTLARCLVDLRHRGELSLSWRVFREHLSLPACFELAAHPLLGDEARDDMRLFLAGIPGVDLAKPAAEQSTSALDQFGYIASYCQRGLATLTGAFGHIYDCSFGDIAYPDVVHRKRIFLSILPSLQNSPEEIKLLGRIDLLGKKQALAQGLATRLEGSLSELTPKSHSDDCVPSLNIMDEYKYISVPGMSITATQGRSLGWASIVGVQSMAGLSVDGKEEADEWLENTSTKFIGSAQGDSTFETMNRIVGSEYVARSQGQTVQDTGMVLRRSKGESTYERANVLDIRDLRAQSEGEFTMVVKDQEIRLQALFVKTPLESHTAASNSGLWVNEFIDLMPEAIVSASVVCARDVFFTALFSEAPPSELLADRIIEDRVQAMG